MVDSPWVFTLVRGSLTWIHHFWLCDTPCLETPNVRLEVPKVPAHVLVTWGLTSRPHQAWDQPCFIHASNGRCAKGAATAGEPTRPNTVASPGKPSNGIGLEAFPMVFLRRKVSSWNSKPSSQTTRWGMTRTTSVWRTYWRSSMHSLSARQRFVRFERILTYLQNVSLQNLTNRNIRQLQGGILIIYCHQVELSSSSPRGAVDRWRCTWITKRKGFMKQCHLGS